LLESHPVDEETLARGGGEIFPGKGSSRFLAEKKRIKYAF
jgi:hypothetical protein